MGFFLSWPYSLNYYDSFLSYLQVIFIFIVIYPIFTWLIDNNSFIDYALYGLSITTVFITFFLIMYFLIGFDIFNDFLYIQKGWGSRFSYGGYEPNITARIMAQCIPILLILAVDSKNLLVKVLNYIFIVLLTLGIILTASRTGLLVLLLGIVAYIFFSFRIDVNKNLKLLLPIFSFILIFIYMANQYPDTFTKPLDRYYTIFSPNESYSSQERLFVLSKSMEKINYSPFVGYGMGNAHNITGVSVHNPIILSWVENGFFGLIGFVLLYIIFFINIIKDYMNKFYNNKTLMILSVMTLMMIAGDMFMANSYKRSLWIPSLLYLSYSLKYSNLFILNKFKLQHK